MPRELLPLQTADLSSFAKSLAHQLALAPHPPGHQSLLNMLARAAGHRNLQSLRAHRPLARSVTALASVGSPVIAPVVVPAVTSATLTLTPAARKALTQFDQRGVLQRWPHKHSVQRLALWVLWTHFEARRLYTERQVNALLNAWHAYGDPATLRRELVGMKLLARKSDCSEYRKLAARPDDEVRALIQAWRRAAV